MFFGWVISKSDTERWNFATCQHFRLLAVDNQANLSSSVFECPQQFLCMLHFLGDNGKIICKVKIGDMDGRMSWWLARLYFEPKLRIVEGDAQSVIKDDDEEIRGCSVTLQNPGSDVKEVCLHPRFEQRLVFRGRVTLEQLPPSGVFHMRSEWQTCVCDRCYRTPSRSRQRWKLVGDRHVGLFQSVYGDTIFVPVCHVLVESRSGFS